MAMATAMTLTCDGQYSKEVPAYGNALYHFRLRTSAPSIHKQCIRALAFHSFSVLLTLSFDSHSYVVLSPSHEPSTALISLSYSSTTPHFPSLCLCPPQAKHPTPRKPSKVYDIMIPWVTLISARDQWYAHQAVILPIQMLLGAIGHTRVVTTSHALTGYRTGNVIVPGLFTSDDDWSTTHPSRCHSYSSGSLGVCSTFSQGGPRAYEESRSVTIYSSSLGLGPLINEPRTQCSSKHFMSDCITSAINSPNATSTFPY